MGIADDRGDALANGSRRVGHGAHDGRLFPQRFLECRDGGAGCNADEHCLAVAHSLQRGQCVAHHLRLDGDKHNRRLFGQIDVQLHALLF